MGVASGNPLSLITTPRPLEHYITYILLQLQVYANILVPSVIIKMVICSLRVSGSRKTGLSSSFFYQNSVYNFKLNHSTKHYFYKGSSSAKFSREKCQKRGCNYLGKHFYFCKNAIFYTCRKKNNFP